MGSAQRVIQFPDRRGANDPAPKKVLVVEADYFTLTSRVDPNVIFWKAGEYRLDPLDPKKVKPIPAGVTHLWVAKFAPDYVRKNLFAQADARKIEIWNCPIGLLITRLLPVWSEPTNRSTMRPADSEIPEPVSDDLGIGLGADTESSQDSIALTRSEIVVASSRHAESVFEEVEIDDDDSPEFDQFGEQLDPEASRKQKRLRLMKQIQKARSKKKARVPAKVQSERPIHKPASTSPKPVLRTTVPTTTAPPRPIAPVQARVDPMSVLGPALTALSKIELGVFESYYALKRKGSPKDTKAASDATGLSEGPVLRTIARCWIRLAEAKFPHDEAWLLKALQHKTD